MQNPATGMKSLPPLPEGGTHPKIPKMNNLFQTKEPPGMTAKAEPTSSSLAANYARTQAQSLLANSPEI